MGSERLFQTLQALSRLPSPGPAPVFSEVHVCRALLVIGDEGPIGRLELSRRLDLGEGVVRTIMKRLAQAKMITTVKDGCVLMKRGASLHSHMRAKLSRTVIVDARQLSLDKASAAVLIRGAGRKVKKGIEQRDAAIRAGATGACTLVVKKGDYVMPMAENEEWKLRSVDPLTQDLRNAFSPEDNDVITIISAPDEKLAEHGAMAAALTLLK